MEPLTTFVIFLALSVSFWLLTTGWMLYKRQQQVKPRSRLIASPVFGAWTRPLAELIPLREKARIQLAKELVSSGNFRLTALDDFLAKRNGAIALSILAVAFSFGIGLADGRELWVGGGGGLVSLLVFAIPRLLLSRRASARIRQIEHGLPDALDMMAMSVSSGVTLDQTIRQTSVQLRKTHKSLAQELAIVSSQASMGSIDGALQALARRVDLPEVSALCAVMVQSQINGGRTVDSLEQYASRIRRDRKNRAERAGNTASIKLLLPVVTCLCPPIAVMLVGPAMVDFKAFLNRNRSEAIEASPVASPVVSTSERALAASR